MQETIKSSMQFHKHIRDAWIKRLAAIDQVKLLDLLVMDILHSIGGTPAKVSFLDRIVKRRKC
jgi:hypothetical protein